MTLASQATVLAVSRIANYGLLLLSPIVLVRLLSVEEFGQYREFLVYASLLNTIAAFSIPDSLLYFIPTHPQSPWRVVRQTMALTAIVSTTAVGVLVAADFAADGALVGAYLLPLALYTAVLVNFDFWEQLFLAHRRAGAVFAYTSARLTLRMLTVILAAALTHDVAVIIWSLIALEGTRLIAAAIAWKVLDRARDEPPVRGLWRDLLRFCIPTGIASLVSSLSGNLSRIAIVKLLGPAALARYTIGTYLEPIIVSVRGSVSTVVLPEMVRRDRQSETAQIALWHRSIVVTAMLLFPLAVLIARFAEPIVTTVFGAAYREGALVLQIAMLVVIRECFDFAPPLRAANRTLPLMYSNGLALAVCAGMLVWLLPEAGIAGAAWAVVAAKTTDALYLARQVGRVHGLPLSRLLDWKAMGKTTLAAVIASAVIADSFWTEWLGAAGVLLGGAAYGTAYLLLLTAFRVRELTVVLEGMRQIARTMRLLPRG